MNDFFMNVAIDLAKVAYSNGEIPVGAVIVKNNTIISSAFNKCQIDRKCTRHAEIIAIEKACEIIGDKYLDGCEMYVTLEPCAMCAGAIINARISRLYFGAFEKESGACGSVVNLFLSTNAYKKTDVFPGCMEEECRRLMTDFFRKELR